jgi:hypothetical protein
MQDSQVEAIGEPVVISEVTLSDADDTGSITIQNSGDIAIDVSGWFVCNFPAYWPIPDGTSLEAGASLQIHAGAGENGASAIFAAGGFGAVTGGSAGEVALYRDNSFASEESIVAYVGWDGGGQRKAVAQGAGLWGEDDVTTAAEDTIEWLGTGTDASAYAIAAQGDPEPEPISSAATFGAALSGSNQTTPVETAAVGGATVTVDGETATYNLAVADIASVSQAHIHVGAAGENGGVIAFLALNDPAVSGAFNIQGTITVDDLLGELEGDWAGFVAGLEAGTLYVNVHTAANPGGELRGQLELDADGGVSITVAVAAGSSLLGWFGADTDSTTVLASQPLLTGIWWLGPDGWVLDSPALPEALRPVIAIARGMGILLLAGESTSIEVPLALG